MIKTLAPDILVMLIIAIILDILGLVCLVLSFFGVGFVLSAILDVIGMVFFIPWTLIRSGQVKGKANVVLKKVLKRFIAPSIVEAVPILGDVSFSWTYTVIREAQEPDDQSGGEIQETEEKPAFQQQKIQTNNTSTSPSSSNSSSKKTKNNSS